MRTRIASSIAALVVVLAAAAPANAQGSFADLAGTLKAGDQVIVEDMSRKVTPGSLESVGSTIRITVDGQVQEWSADQVRQIRRRGDSLMNGLKIGVWSGLATGAFFGVAVSSIYQNEGTDGTGIFWGLTALGAGAGAGIGVALDAAIPGSTVVYRSRDRAVSVAPLLSPSAQGARIAFTF